MKILKSWLKDFVGVNISDEELSDKLTFSGSLVEETYQGLDDKIIVAEIKEILPHPNADKLRITKVFDSKEELQIVCGAPNIEVGQRVPLATIGTQIGEIEIKKAEIRGEISHGMMCSQRELGLGDEHAGIYILPDDYEVGEKLNKYLGSDSVFELEITPNRGDCLSHLGIARETAAVLGGELKFEKDFGQFQAKSDFSVEIENSGACFKYLGAKISGVKVAPSPDWLQDRLIKVGINPINNVVDVTNFIMMDLGQPMHAFDASKVKDKIIVRSARSGESIYCLDEITRDLNEEMLVIADSEKPIAIAGVIGGMDSAVSNSTTDIILESALFERKSVRKTAKDLRVMTDASYRFERGLDSEITALALDKAIKMIVEICSGKFEGKFSAVSSEKQDEFVKVEYQKINDLLGLSLTEEQINKELEKVGFEIKDQMAKVPSWRNDVSIWEDLAEEVVRLYGMDKIDKKPVPQSEKPARSDYFYKEHIKDFLVKKGFVEVFNYPFISQKDVDTLGLPSDDLLEVANPIQSDNKFMRNSLKVGIMRNIAKNPTFDPIKVFEVANVFTKETEKSHIGLAVSGKNAGKIMAALAADISSMLGVNAKIDEVTDEEKTKYKIKKPNAFYFELNLADLISEMKNRGAEPVIEIGEVLTKYRKVSKFPPAVRDLAFVVDKDISALEIRNLILEITAKAVLVELFDEFESDKLGVGKKSVAFHIYLQELDKTMADAEADKIISKIIDELRAKFRAELRS